VSWLAFFLAGCRRQSSEEAGGSPAVQEVESLEKTTQWIAGADGCKAGWVVAFVTINQSVFDVRVRVVAKFADIFAASEQPQIVAVDMPIGLPAQIGPQGRGPERAVRPLLGERQSSVFAVPSRGAVSAPDYGAACRIALATSEPPRKVSKQLFMIAPKIREVDALLRGAPDLIVRVFEVHPEVAFWRLNGGQALSEPKKVKSRPYEPGLAQRRSILAMHGFSPAVTEQAAPAGAAADDLLDALACAAIARRILAGRAAPFPDPPSHDEFGLPMAIWA
jgi:predicted RNase H-like nuclease